MGILFWRKKQPKKPRLWRNGDKWFCGEYQVFDRNTGVIIGIWEIGVTPKQAYSAWRKSN